MVSMTNRDQAEKNGHCDQSEKNALLMVWPDLHLQTCIFHLYQAWRRGYTKTLAAGPIREVYAAQNIIKNDLRTLKPNLVTELHTRNKMCTEIEFTAQSFRSQMLHYNKNVALDRMWATLFKAGLTYLNDYLSRFWLEPVVCRNGLRWVEIGQLKLYRFRDQNAREGVTRPQRLPM